MPNNFNKNDAFSMKLGSDKGGAIQHLFPINGGLYAFSTKKIFRIRTADDVDPECLDPATRHSYQEIYPVGCNNSFVARSIIQAKQVLDGVLLRPELSKEKLLDAVWETAKLLLQCENAHFRIYNDAISLLPKVDDIVEKSKSHATISSLPQVDDLDERVGSFLGSAKRFLEKAHALLILFYGCPDLGSNFKAYREWMSANCGDREQVVALLYGDHE